MDTWFPGSRPVAQGEVFEETQSLQLSQPYKPMRQHHPLRSREFSDPSQLYLDPGLYPQSNFLWSNVRKLTEIHLPVLSDHSNPPRYVLRHQEGNLHQHRSLDVSRKIANAAITGAKDILGIDDPAEGVALEVLSVQRQVAFAEEGKVVVCGSDHGKVYVFNHRTGGKIDELHVDREDWVQTLTTVSLNEKPCILAARSRELEGRAHIFIWEKGGKTSTTIPNLLNFGRLILAFMILATWMLHLSEPSGSNTSDS
ncbi:hypothetical protein EV421DRAFT_1911820 [Armillaria borealis]|uniref:WD40 repeat-like protein n=1 Tax=Armillaria borealis TaxID=47425 RepID=A0AA39IYG8_9AGAR|nr:hypothetical protein EV421DRAFT_1911820 [Armillaria borealis]